MLKRLVGVGTSRTRNFSHFAALCEKQAKQIGSQEADGFKDEQVSSIQEKTLFEQIFTQIMKKDEEKKRSKDVLKLLIGQTDPKSGDSLSKQRDNVQVVFEKKKSKPVDATLSKFFRDAVGDMSDSGNLARMTTEDIRKYPVSLTPTYFSSEKTSGNAVDGKDVEQSTPVSAGAYIKNVLTSEMKLSSQVETAESGINPNLLKQIEVKNRLTAKLEKLLGPYLLHLQNRVQTDGDCILVIQELLSQYLKRNPELETDSLEHLEQNGVENPTFLPQPFHVTMPFIIRHLLTSADYRFPPERRYTLISLIYNSCKTATDVSLYLNVCNIDFYNLLIELSWENYQEIHQVKQLVAEMTANGIIGDLHTVELLTNIAKTMRYMNDGIADDSTCSDTALTVGVVWCRENAHDLNYIEDYLRKLKESQSSSV
ncbi:LAME_0F05600g1_1 [Lachancea meyersii CBS 8951]|uniref:LAME_0F05600g1_1 n=1 Tax=Lachancea meyersii CBS 8951 TaxID=1266667 RepID=A0A1G4JSV8_9SACH|nr:LAME_0F05600g1_1 [Lachancea meyersii CBS 8951]